MAAKPQTASESLKRLPIYTSRTVANTIKKFDVHSSSPSQEEPPCPVILITNSPQLSRKPVNTTTHSASNSRVDAATSSRIGQDSARRCKHATETDAEPRLSKIDRLVKKLEKNKPNDGGNDLVTAKPTVKYRSPSPSLLRKTQAVINKEQCNELYRAKHNLGAHKVNQPSPLSPNLSRRQNDSFKRATAFWNSPKT